MAFENYRIAISADASSALASVNRLDARLKGISATSKAVQAQFVRMYGVLLGGAGIAGGIREIAKFEQSMAAVRGISGATNDEFDRMNKTVRDLAKVAPFTARQTADGMQDLARAGLDAQQSMDALPGTLLLAEVGMIEMSAAADISTNVLAGFGLQVNELDRVVDVLAKSAASANTTVGLLGTAMSYVAPIAKSVGVEIEEAAAVVSVLSNAGIKGERAGTGLRKVLIDLADAGYDMSNGLLPVLQELSRDITTVSEASELVGKRAASAFLVMLEGVKDVERLGKAYKDAGGFAQETAEIMRDNLQYAFDTLKSAVSELILVFGDFYGEDLKAFIDSITDSIVYLTDNVHILKDAVTALATAIGILIGVKILGGLAALGGTLLGIIGSMKFFLTGGIGALLGGLGSIAGLLFKITTLGAGAIAVLASFRETFMKSNNPAFRELGISLQALVDTIGELIGVSFPSITSWMDDPQAFFTDIAEVMKDIIKEFRHGLIKLRGLIKSIPAYINELIADNPIATALLAGGAATAVGGPLAGVITMAGTAMHTTSGSNVIPSSQDYADFAFPLEVENKLIQDNIQYTKIALQEKENWLEIVSEMAKKDRVWANEMKNVQGEIEGLTLELDSLYASLNNIPSELDWIAAETQRLLNEDDANELKIKAELDEQARIELLSQFNSLKAEMESTPINLFTTMAPGFGTADFEQTGLDPIGARTSFTSPGFATDPERNLGFGATVRRLTGFSGDNDNAGAFQGLTIEDVQAQIQQRLEDERQLIELGGEQAEVQSQINALRNQYANIEGVNLERAVALAESHRQEIIDQRELRREFEQTQRTVQFFANTLEGAFTTVTDTFIDNFSKMKDFAESLEDAFEDFATSVVKEIARMEAAAIASKIFSFFTGGATGGGSLIGSLFGFAEGGSFTVGGTGGTDSQPVAFSATPGERVTIETPEQQRMSRGKGGATTINVTYQVEVSGNGDENLRTMFEGILEEKKPQIIEDTIVANQNAQRNDPALVRQIA